MNKPLRIGLIDDRLEKAHATLLLGILRATEGETGCRVTACTARAKESGRAWAQEKEVPYFESAQAMKGEIDAIIIPASSTPELHFELLRTAAVCETPVFIDKPLAPSAAEGLQMLRFARERKIRLFSSSALRFAEEIAAIRSREHPPELVQIWAGWSERFDEFLIHPVELAICLIGSEVLAASRRTSTGIDRITLYFPEDRTAEICFSPAHQPYEFTASWAGEWQHHAIRSRFFDRMVAAMTDAFRGEPLPVQGRETMTVLKAMDAARASSRGERVALEWSEEEILFLDEA